MASAASNAACNVQVVAAGRIRCVQFSVSADLDADSEAYIVELATVPTIQARTHNSQGSIATVSETNYLLTSGAAISGQNVSYPCDIPVEAGQLTYPNGALTGTSAVKVTCIVTIP